ncbi:BMP family ABC transporter substrate-binding protein [Clostridia bacterium]|nr:BMP family ABC transporter substrate-binding protein [Clostridia bacterium]
MKKILATLLILALALPIALSACTDAGKTDPTGGTDADGNAVSSAGIDKSVIKVGVVHIGNPNEPGYSMAHDQGIIAMQMNLGLSDDQIRRKNNIPDSDAEKTKTAINELIEEGCNIIFGTSFNYMDTMETLAKDNPTVYFSHGTGYKSNDTNFNNYFGRIYQARYLAGIAAGLKTVTGKIGYVAAMDISNSEVTGGINAFAKGVKAVNPDAQVYVKVTNTWFDLALESATAEALLDLDCDVIAQHCDTTAPQIAAQNRQVWGCGYNTDMTEVAPDAHLTAPIWNWGVYYTTAAEAVINGTWKQLGNYFGGLNEGFIDISPLTKNVAPGTSEIVESVRTLIKDGTIAVFDGKQIQVSGTTVTVTDEALKDNSGNTIVEAGKASLSDSTITGGINWYYENVILS